MIYVILKQMIKDFTRYARNTEVFSKEEIYTLHEKSACIVGCGGLGGYVIQTLARFGIGALTLVDGDVFHATNLNRQLFSTETNLGQNKALCAREALGIINSDVTVNTVEEMLTEENAREIITGHDVILDCLDTISARLILEDACQEENIPFVHGAIGGFGGQVSVIFPGDRSLHTLYGSSQPDGHMLGNPPFTAQLVSALQCGEAIKLLVGRGELLRGKLLFVDMYQNTFDVTDIK
jgi:molybdopterin/thiamine biosynthesis adenylyltransferase